MSELREEEIRVFIDSVRNYFVQLTTQPALVRASYLAGSEAPCFSYTGLITLSGQFRGCVYVSAQAEMLSDLLKEMHEPDCSEENLLDTIGELANTIAGNARRHFGSGLEISVPVAIKGVSEQIRAYTRQRPLVILVQWQQHQVGVVVDLKPE
ncbi:MAG: chemotaxis protein CheX [Spongiibacteraceae bacterium]